MMLDIKTYGKRVNKTIIFDNALSVCAKVVENSYLASQKSALIYENICL